MEAHDGSTLARRYVEEVLNGGDLGVVDALFSPAITFHDPTAPAGIIHGIEPLKHALTVMRTASPNLHVAIAALLSQGDEVAWRGTVAGPQHTMAGTKRFSLPLSEFYRVANGKIVEAWVFLDMLNLRQQVGALPGAAPAGA